MRVTSVFLLLLLVITFGGGLSRRCTFCHNFTVFLSSVHLIQELRWYAGNSGSYLDCVNERVLLRDVSTITLREGQFTTGEHFVLTVLKLIFRQLSAFLGIVVIRCANNEDVEM